MPVFAPSARDSGLRAWLPLALVGVVAALMLSCGPSISRFNATAYEQATSLKVESLSLMDAATESYETHASAVKELKSDLDKAHEFAKGRPHNEISARQWALLTDPHRNLLGGFLGRWEEETSLNIAFVEEKKEQVAEAFDTIIELESGKLDPESVKGDT